MKKRMALLRVLAVVFCGLLFITAGCQTRGQTGAAVGGTAGAGLGAMVADDTATGALIGGLLGGAAGYFAGTQLTEEDRKNVYDVLEDTPTGETDSWTSDGGAKFYVTPTRTWTQNGRQYREIDVRVVKENGVTETDNRVAYRENGKWNIEPG
jgi:surface antigen